MASPFDVAGHLTACVWVQDKQRIGETWRSSVNLAYSLNTTGAVSLVNWLKRLPEWLCQMWNEKEGHKHADASDNLET
jgi:hypothetical protein